RANRLRLAAFGHENYVNLPCGRSPMNQQSIYCRSPIGVPAEQCWMNLRIETYRATQSLGRGGDGVLDRSPNVRRMDRGVPARDDKRDKTPQSLRLLASSWRLVGIPFTNGFMPGGPTPVYGFAFTRHVAKCLVRNAETSASIDLRFTLGIESTKLNARQREVVLCPSLSAQNSAATKSPGLSAPAAWVRCTALAT